MCYNRAVEYMWRHNMENYFIDNIVKKAVAGTCVTAMLFAFASCDNSKIYSNPEMTASQTQSETEELTYDSVYTRTKEFDEELSLYMKDHLSEATVKQTEGTSYAGVPVTAVYTVSADGKYRALQMEKTFDDRIVVEEYFDMGDAILFARTTVYNDGDYDPVEKYYITGGIVYKMDAETKSLVTITEVGSESAAQYQTDLDMYFTFDEIVAIYG